MEKPYWEGKEYSYFSHKNCEYFPCHKGLDDFNCLFCYCPLYTLGTGCGGNYKILSNGIKDCSDCIVCHLADSHKLIESKFNLISAIEKQNRK